MSKRARPDYATLARYARSHAATLQALGATAEAEQMRADAEQYAKLARIK